MQGDIIRDNSGFINYRGNDTDKIFAYTPKEDRKTPAKFIGSINNVNAQMMHEQELRSIAEVDALTALLNESAMQEHASSFLEEKPGDSLCPECGTSYDQLFHCADEALYQVKHDGKNGFKIFQ